MGRRAARRGRLRPCLQDLSVSVVVMLSESRSCPARSARLRAIAALCALTQVLQVLRALLSGAGVFTIGPMPPRFRKISSQIFLAQLAILTASLFVGFGLFTQEARNNLDHEYQARAESIAQTFAEIPTVRSCMASGADG